eukprot:scaffold34071_cov95-Skeletonema_marinoi.AAC.1
MIEQNVIEHITITHQPEYSSANYTLVSDLMQQNSHAASTTFNHHIVSNAVYRAINAAHYT